MSKIKKVKIKQNNGEFIEVPIGAEANNVTYGDLTLQEALNNIQLTKVNSNIILTKPNGNQNIVSDDNTTYPIVSQTQDGIMSAEDKIKLDCFSNPRMKLLWKNPDMGENAMMDNQTIVLSSDDYDYLTIYYIVDSSVGHRYMKSTSVLKGYAGILDVVAKCGFGDPNKAMIAQRKFIYTRLEYNDYQTIFFWNAEVQWPNDDAMQTWRRACLPCFIYGGKFN